MKAYIDDNDSVKKVLRTMFPDIDFEAKDDIWKCLVECRVKTFEDACRELGEDNELVLHYRNLMKVIDPKDISMTDIVAYLKLRIICAALNEVWEGQFTKDKDYWYPVHFLWEGLCIAGKSKDWRKGYSVIDTGDYVTEYDYFSFSHADKAVFHQANSFMSAPFGSHLCLKSFYLANHCGTQFIHEWADFTMRRRR